MHLNFDDAWPDNILGLDVLDLRKWGPQLRFSAPPRLIEKFYAEVAELLPPFLLYGSGDFHHLSALWLRRHANQPLSVVSFDNHPDWDVRPPKWCCGSWINRALELPSVKNLDVWGCGNFECWWPGQLFGNRRAERRGRLAVHPWADNRSASEQKRRGAILSGNWRERFSSFANSLNDAALYVTIDLDCLRAEDAITNWENGRFAADDVAWALQELKRKNQIVAGDICGAFSEPVYARRKQRFASEMDHPKLARPASAELLARNTATVGKLWPLLAERNEHDPGAD